MKATLISRMERKKKQKKKKNMMVDMANIQ